MPVAPSSPVLRLKNVFRHYQMSWGGRGQHCTWLRSILIDAGKKKRDRWINLIMTIKSDFTPTSFCARVCLVAQLCPTLCDSMDCSPPGSSSRQKYWSEYPFPSLGDLPNPGIELGSPALQADSLPLSSQGSPEFQTSSTE